eukprot:6225277-Pyramimonas_sp.AAC.1
MRAGGRSAARVRSTVLSTRTCIENVTPSYVTSGVLRASSPASSRARDGHRKALKGNANPTIANPTIANPTIANPTIAPIERTEISRIVVERYSAAHSGTVTRTVHEANTRRRPKVQRREPLTDENSTTAPQRTPSQLTFRTSADPHPPLSPACLAPQSTNTFCRTAAVT